MSEDDGSDGSSVIKVPPRHDIPHYHGDEVRWLFVVGALLLVVAKSTGTDLPLSTFGAVMSAVILVVAAGITNPATPWIHWMNEFIAVFGTLIFGMTAVEHYRAGLSFFDTSFFFVEALTLISLVALYFTTRTIRGMLQRENFS